VSHAGESSSIYRLAFAVSSFGGLRLTAWRGEWASYFNPDIPLRFELQLGLPICLLVGTVVRKLNCQNLQVLQLESAEPLTTSLWVRLFGTLPLLTSIGILQGERELFGALVEPGGIPVHPEHTNTLCNTRTTLPFRALRIINVGRRSKLYSEEDLEFMLKCLRKRLDLRMGLTILSFCLDGGEGLKLQANAFKEVVKVVKIYAK